jgi:hypothetical protein
MGTFGTGAFASDGAMDLLDDLAEQPAEDRADAVGRLLDLARAKPELLWREFFPDQIVAAAAIVAATLPGGESFDERLRDLADRDLAPDVRLPTPARQLAAQALEALLSVGGPDGPWHQGWTTESDAAEARETTDTLARVLRDARRDRT